MSSQQFFEFHEDWVRDLPSGWSQEKLKYLVKYNAEVIGEDTDPNFEFNYIEIGNVDLISGVKLNKKINFQESPSSARRILRKDDILISTVRTYLRAISQVPDSPFLVGSTGFCVLRKDSERLDFRYLYYSVISDWFVERVVCESEGVCYPTINSSDLVELKVIIPPLGEQKLISLYLDKKTSQIDSLIEKIQKRSELLKEQRTSLINQYVTKGLDSNVEMKDSGVEWIGEIPKHWEVRRLAALGSFSKGKSITKGDLTDSGEAVILYSHLYTTYDRVTNLPCFFVSEEKSLKSTKISQNTFLFTSSGESVDEIGKCLLYSGEGEISVGGDLVIFTLNSEIEIDPKFLSFSFNSKNCQDQKSSMSRGEIVVHIYEKQLRGVVVAVPPMNEQYKIRNHLEKVEVVFQRSDELLKNKIDTLKEYRQSLISSVVTGKVRVTEDMI